VPGTDPEVCVTFSNAALWLAIAIGGAVAVTVALRFVYRTVGAYRIRRAGPRALRAERHRIWRDPGTVGKLDLASGPGGRDGAPVPPFRFREEHATGSQPCVGVIDARGRRWRVKWGPEARSEAFAVRLAWACGYFAEITYFLPTGTIEGCTELQRARQCIDERGRFIDARFELDDPKVRKLFEEHSWSWDDNPFLGTCQLNGLKIVVMLLSNWDTKDRRDVARGSNTAIFEHRRSRWRGGWEARYLLTDWGGSMGRWGANIVTRGRWDPDGFVAQTPQFVTGVRDGRLSFGYAGQRTADIAGDIPLEHAAWFGEIAAQLHERQLIDGLIASGANRQEAERFASALCDRIRQLVDAASGTPALRAIS
jgi:hypothetical protein